MNAISTRLKKFSPVFSAKERALLVFHAAQQELKEDPEWRGSMPEAEMWEFNRYLELLHVVAVESISSSVNTTNQIEDVVKFIRQAAQIGNAATQLEDELEEGAVEPSVRTRNGGKRVSLPTFLRGLEANLRKDAFELALDAWKELRAQEIVWQEVAAEFDGADPLIPEVRRSTETSRRRMTKLVADLAPAKRPKGLPEPDDASVELQRQIIEMAMQAQGYKLQLGDCGRQQAAPLPMS